MVLFVRWAGGWLVWLAQYTNASHEWQSSMKLNGRFATAIKIRALENMKGIVLKKMWRKKHKKI